MKKRTEQILTILGLSSILALSIILNFYNLGDYPFNPDEGVYSAQSAIWSGHSEYNKNFLLYSRSATNFQIHQFIVAQFFKVYGISEYVARLPSAIFGTLTVLLVFLLADTLFNRRTAMFSAFLVATNNYLIHFNRQNHLDTTLVFLMTLSMLLFIKWHQTRKNYYFYTFLIISLLMVMVKIIIIVPFGVLILLYLYIQKELHVFKDMLFKPFSILIMMLSLLYAFHYIYSIVGIQNYIDTFIYAVGRESKQFSTFYVDIIELFMGQTIPIIAIIGIANGMKTRNKEDVFISIWAAAVLLFFTYYPLQGYSYILPMVPAIAILNARVLDRLIGFANVPIFISLILLIAIPMTAYSAMSYPYNTLASVNNIDSDIITRFDPIRYVAVKDAGSWMKNNVDTNSGILTYTFADQHSMAFYSGLRTYTIKNYPGFYMPVNGTAKIIWNDSFDSFELLKNGEINYVLYMEEKSVERNLIALNKTDGLGYDLIYYNSYHTPDWYRGGNLNVSIFKVTKHNISQTNKLGNSSFTIVSISDTQTYPRYMPYILRSQVEWIKKNKDNLNIQFVIHSGDMVENANNIQLFDKVNNTWSILDGYVPYIMTIGNHDYNDLLARNDTAFNTYFNYTRFIKYSWYKGHYNGSDNSYGLFSSGGDNFLVMNLNMCPSDDELNWANNIINSYPDKKVILSTHSYLNTDGNRHNVVCRSLGLIGNDGEDIWNKLVSQHDNIILTVSGHKYGMAKRMDYINGQPIMQVVSDYETLPNGGDGFLRFYVFTPIEKRVDVYTYSPYENVYDSSAENQFSFMYRK